MDEKSVKPKRVGNHYIPPPARKQGIDMNEATRHKERPMKTCENRGVKLCNDSSLLFKESNDKVKEKSRRSRRSKRTTKKADAENASLHGENEVVESKSSFTAPGLTDRITNFQSDTGSDVSVVLVENTIVKAVYPLAGLENMKQLHAVEVSTEGGYGEEDNLLTSLKPPHPSDQDIALVSKEVENQLQYLNIIASSDYGTTHLTKYELELLKPLCSSHPDISHMPEKVEHHLSSLKLFHSSNQKINDSHGEESQSKTLINDPTSEFSSQDFEDYPVNICDGVRTSSKESVYVDCDGGGFAIENHSSCGISKIQCLTQSGLGVSSDSTEWNVANNNSQIYSVEDGDWDSIYDDRGDCLLPSAAGSAESKLFEVSKNNMEVKSSDPKKVDDDDRPHETSSIIEIYGFSEDLKTSDILTAFGSWVTRGFNLKWVDNTHALGIFPSPTLAEEVLGNNIPLVKIRPISQGTTLSQERARTLVLPSSLRPKTCTALARRLVSGALGLKVNVSPEERAAERELLREAREKKKLVSKQRDAAWEGNFSSLDSWYVDLSLSNKSVQYLSDK